MDNNDVEILDMDESFESAAPVQAAVKPAAVIQAPPNPITEIGVLDDPSHDLAVVSALMSDEDGRQWASAAGIDASDIPDPDAKLIWAAWQKAGAGCQTSDLFSLHDQTKIPIPRLLSIADIDRAGTYLKSAIKGMRARAYKTKAAAIGKFLHDNPDQAEEMMDKLSKLTAFSQTSLLPDSGATDFKITPATDKTCLLGNHYLDRGAGAVLVGNSGMGKSSMMLQMAVVFALGRAFEGLKPNGKLKSLIIQSEDSDNDIAEVMASIAYSMKLTKDDIEIVRENVRIVTDRMHRGVAFMAELKGQIIKVKPDLVWINPLAAFVDGDISNAEEAGVFLREQLNSINQDQLFAYIAVHHTTKPSAEKKEAKWNEAQYGMAGSYEVISWARAIMILKAGDNDGQFDLLFAKRGSRAGIRVETESESGLKKLELTKNLPLQHSKGSFTPPGSTESIPVIFWEQRYVAPSERKAHAGGRPKKNDIMTYIPVIPGTKAKAIPFMALHRFANELRYVSRSTFQRLVDDGVLNKFIAKDTSNPGQPKFYLDSDFIGSGPPSE